MVDHIESSGTEAGRLGLAGASEALLEAFDRLTASYERSMSILIDPQITS
ncbi:MAG: hypothetical protein H0T52_05055 [Lautropia sp.]|nr:hypothetical protein [Lautropia sp.]